MSSSSTIYTQETQTLRDQNLQTVTRLDSRIIWQFIWAGRQLTAQHLIATHTSVRIHRENTWPHTVYGQLLFLTGLNHETNLLLWHCPTQQEGNATGLKTPRKWHSNGAAYRYRLGVTWQQYYGGSNATYVFWQTYTTHQQGVISAILMGRP